MAFTLAAVTPPAETWHTVSLSPETSIDFLIRRPNHAQRLAEHAHLVVGVDAEQYAAQVQSRIKAVVCDWRGVTDEQGRAVPFALEKVWLACNQLDGLLPALIRLSSDAYHRPDDEKKVSPAPHTDSLPAAQ